MWPEIRPTTHLIATRPEIPEFPAEDVKILSLDANGPVTARTISGIRLLSLDRVLVLLKRTRIRPD